MQEKDEQERKRDRQNIFIKQWKLKRNKTKRKKNKGV